MFFRNVLIIGLNFIIPGWGLAAATGRWAFSLGIFLLHLAAVYFPAHLLLGRTSLSAPELLLMQAGIWTLLTALLSIFVLKMVSVNEKTHLEISAALIFAVVSAVLLAGNRLKGGSLFIAHWVVADDDTLSPSLGLGKGAYCAKPPFGSRKTDAESYLGQIGLFSLNGDKVLRRVLAVGAVSNPADNFHVKPVTPASPCFKGSGRAFRSSVAQAALNSGRLSTALPPGTALIGADSLSKDTALGPDVSVQKPSQTLRTVSIRSLICIAEPLRSATAQESCQ